MKDQHKINMDSVPKLNVHVCSLAPGFMTTQEYTVRAKIVARKFESGNVIYSTPPNLVDKLCELLEYENTAYDAQYPTGYERSYFKIRLDDGTEHEIDAAFVTKPDGNAIFWDDIKHLPRNFVG